MRVTPWTHAGGSISMNCRRCSALRRCPGVSRAYAKRYGTDELVPFTAPSPAPPGTRANSFNFVRTGTAVPWTPVDERAEPKGGEKKP